MANLTDQDVLDDDKLPALPAGLTGVDFLVFHRDTDAVYLATAAQVAALLVKPTPVANQKPIVALTVQPSAGVVGQPLTLSATATDPDGQIVGPLEFFLGGQPIGQKASAPYDLSYTPTASGSAIFSVKATDNSGDSTVAYAPAVLVTATPLLASTITFPSPGNKTVGDPGFTLTATSTSPAPITFSSSAPAVISTTSGGNATVGTAGQVVLTASQAAGNGYAAGSTNQTVTVSAAATQKPVVGLEINPQNINLGDSSQLFASPSSANSTIVSVRFFDNGTQVGAPVTASPWQFIYTPLQAGVRAITARATDALGVESDPSNVQNLTVTGPPPSYNRTISKTLPLGSPEQSDGIVFKADTTQELSFDALTNVAGNNVSLQITDSSNGSVCYADLFDDYAGKPYSFKRADGFLYYGTFPNKDTNFTA